jgi:hypothetical protein
VCGLEKRRPSLTEAEHEVEIGWHWRWSHVGGDEQKGVVANHWCYHGVGVAIGWWERCGDGASSWCEGGHEGAFYRRMWVIGKMNPFFR